MVHPSPTKIESSDARQRLLSAALRLFAEKGYEATSIRAISEAANVNIASISYYFGSKAGLYRAAFTEPMCESSCKIDLEAYALLSLAEAIRRFFSEYLEPLKKGEEVRWVMKLHFREMVEPTGAWQQEIDEEIKPQHEALLVMLQKHFGLTEIDTDLHRLAFSIVGLAVHFYVGQDIIAAISAPMMNSPEAIDRLAERLAGFAMSMIAGEAERRANSGAHEI